MVVTRRAQAVLILSVVHLRLVYFSVFLYYKKMLPHIQMVSRHMKRCTINLVNQINAILNDTDFSACNVSNFFLIDNVQC